MSFSHANQDAKDWLAKGASYYVGIGTDINYLEAEKWLRKSAELGNDSAQFYLGMFNHFGYGVSKNTEESIKWLRKSAEQENQEAVIFLSVVHDISYPRKANNKLLPKKAADKGDPQAQYDLGHAYLTGYLVPIDPVESFKWFQKSAEQGNAAAQRMLAVAYFTGKGVQQNLDKALFWYGESCKNGLYASCSSYQIISG